MSEDQQRVAYKLLRTILDGKQLHGVVQCVPVEFKDTQGYVLLRNPNHSLQNTQSEFKLTKEEFLPIIAGWSQPLNEGDVGQLSTICKEKGCKMEKGGDVLFITRGTLQTLKSLYE